MKKSHILALLFVLILSPIAFATHLRGGEITAKRISNTSLTYRITVTVYYDEANGRTASQGQNDVTVYTGVGNTSLKIKRTLRKGLSGNTSNTSLNQYDTTFTYPAPGVYTLRCGILNRNANVVNIGSPSDQISFFVESTIVINAALGLNSTPVLLNAPIDSAAVGVRYIHNPAAFDVDGDSLAYRLAIPKKDQGQESGIGVLVNGYRSPETVGTAPFLAEDRTTPAFFTINSLTGDLIWDAPQQEGQYNVAFIVEEWRNGIKIGEIVRDMQIIVVKTENKPPRLETPTEICVEAGQTVNFTVRATDKDVAHRMKITSISGVYNLDQSNTAAEFILPEAATFTTPVANQANPATGTFTWNTNCKHVRFQSYDVIFKVEDFPGRLSTQLVDIKTTKIKVIAPRPQALTAKIQSNGIALTWRKYTSCVSTIGAEIVVYRRDGCTTFKPDKCETGLPSALGYREVARVPASDSVYLDKSAVRGTAYSYRVVASFLPPANAQSVASDEACLTIPEQMPVMTNVSVQKTDKVSGEIFVKWSRPIGLDTTLSKGPYQYRLFRALGITSNAFTEVYHVDSQLKSEADTTFIDKNLNTVDNVYRYKLEFYFTENKALKKLDETFAASSVRLVVQAENKQMRLNWTASTPWRNDNQKHRIYRKQRNGMFNLVAEVGVQGINTYTYLDNGADLIASDGNISTTIATDTAYCYKVETIGIYEEKRFAVLGRLANFSQETCATASDDTPPCTPTLTIDNLDCKSITCSQSAFNNRLTWTMPQKNEKGDNCKPDIVKYSLYYARYKDDKPKLLTSVDAVNNAYQHNGLSSFAGCYYITATNRLGQESKASNTVCKDNCPTMELPNAFTPNGDGKNDTFTALDCSPFLQSVSFQVYNRWGALVYETTAVPFAWDGRNTLGEDLSAGLYYYLLQYTYNRLDKKDESPKTIKGWVELLK